MNDQKQIKILVVGALLIAAVVALSLIRPGFKKKTSPENPPASVTKDTTPKITVEELEKKIGAREDIKIIDLRNPDRFKLEHLQDSQNFFPDEILSSPGVLDSNKTYVFLDEGEVTVARDLVVALLENSESKKLSYLSGGFLAWKIQDKPTVSEGNPNSFSDQSKVTYLKADDLKKEMDSKPDELFIIDLRKKEAFQEGHLIGAQNIFFEELESRYREIPLGRKIVLYDKDGLWSFQAAVKLFDLGVFNVFSMPEGLDGWKAKELPIIK